MSNTYNKIKIDSEEAAIILDEFYGLKGRISAQAGEIDFNFKVATESGSFLLKVSRPNADNDYLAFQEALLDQLTASDALPHYPQIILTKKKTKSANYEDKNGELRVVRVLNWIEGRLWSSVNPINEHLLYSLGQHAGKISQTLKSFEHPFAQRDLEWDVAQGDWIKDYIHLFNNDEKAIADFFYSRFQRDKESYALLPKTIVHNDVNDNNNIVSDDLIKPDVRGVIDYGDAIYTQTINDLAITLAYAVMDLPDPLEAACEVVKGYHKAYPLSDEELKHLYTLVAIRLLISVAKSAINKHKEPDNLYLQSSEEPAWALLRKWHKINDRLAYYSFRKACGLTAHPNQTNFIKWAKESSVPFSSMFPSINFEKPLAPDFGIGSTWVGHENEQNDLDLLTSKIKLLQKKNPGALLVGGYLEKRSIYTTDAYKIESNNGLQYRSVHLGLDFWLTAETPIHAIMDGRVISIANNDRLKDYGPTIILEHETVDGLIFYTLYGHLSLSSLSLHQQGDLIKKGDLIAYIGDSHENGYWSPHLHFQVMLDMIGNTVDFPGVASQHQINVWQSLCPDPNTLFSDETPLSPQSAIEDLIPFRKRHLGKSLSLSYEEPLTILRGSGAYLIDANGRKYLDTVNNVAHVGHEHPDVVQAGQSQMAVLNTNTRYLHPNINEFAKELLLTFPPELCVVHFVNSGSEANELALRMAKAVTGQQDFIALEVGYHGNTSACIDVSSYKFDGKGGNGKPPHTHIVPLPDSYRGLYQGENTGKKYSAHVSEQIEMLTDAECGIAGFIAEPIVSCGGQIELPADYLNLAYAAVRAAGGLCISDEVQVGCGRVGSHFWGFEMYDVTPDIVTIGKPIGNGHPLGAVVCTREVADAFANGMEYFNTFGGNPVSCAIGGEVLQVVKREELQKNALNTGNYLKKELERLQSVYPIIGDVRGQGLFLGFELATATKQPLAEHTSYLANRMKTLGVLMSVDGPDQNVIKIKPPMVFSKKEATLLIARLDQVFAENFMQSF
jgi:4-aminobutyrate aminotransferase-like enzyme/Ser/Thr protein kinase RdoA (MazF antagonist)